MSKYYKAKDVIRAIAENLAWNDNRINKGKNDCTDGWEEWIEDAEDVVFNLQTIEVNEEDELKFYYVDSIDDYWIGRRLDHFYYAEWKDRLGFVWSKSRYLPWGEHVVAPDTLWKEHTYPSEPREIPFTEWIVGFMKKYGSKVSEDCISRDWVLNRLTKYQKDYALNELDDWQNTVVEWITTDIENAPSVIPKKGTDNE